MALASFLVLKKPIKARRALIARKSGIATRRAVRLLSLIVGGSMIAMVSSVSMNLLFVLLMIIAFADRGQ